MIDHMLVNLKKYYEGKFRCYIGMNIKAPKSGLPAYYMADSPVDGADMLPSTAKPSLTPAELENKEVIAQRLNGLDDFYLLIQPAGDYSYINCWIKLSDLVKNGGVSHSHLTHSYRAFRLVRREISMTISKILFDDAQYIRKSKRTEGEGSHNRNHNNIYRGLDLGTFNDTYEQAIQDGTFDNEYIGDTFTMNGHTYHIAGFNTEWGTEKNTELGNHICLITDNFGDSQMNSSDTTQGGFAGSDMFRNTLPRLVSQLEEDWGDYLLEFNEFLSTGIDLNGAPNNGAWFKVQASLMNTTQVFGAPTRYSNNANGEKYNIGNENSILPLFKLKPSDRKTGYWWWLRDIYNSRVFADVSDGGSAHLNDADNDNGVRAFFLVN